MNMSCLRFHLNNTSIVRRFIYIYLPFVPIGIGGRLDGHTVPGTLLSKSSWTALILFNLFKLIMAAKFLLIVCAKYAGGNTPSKNRLAISGDAFKLSK